MTKKPSPGGRATTILKEFLTGTSPKASGCAVCHRRDGLTDDAVRVIDLARPSGRGPITTMNWLRGREMWPARWSEGRIVAHWRHS